MSFKLRPYQLEFVEDIRKNLATYKHIIACAATGAGKSKIFISIANAAKEKGRTVLILSESKRIFEQIEKEITADHIKAGKSQYHIADGSVYLAMAQTLSRRVPLIEQFKALGSSLLIICDECHIGTHTKLLKQIGLAYLIGFTATPDWRSAKHLSELYQACVVGPQPEELVQDGFLASYKHYARVAADLSALSVQNGEYTEQSQEAAFETKKVYDGLIEDIRTIPFKKAIIFTSSIKHCNAVSEKLTAAGIPNVYYHSQLSPAEQSYNMGQYRDGPINICVSVGILTKGFDFPAIDLVILQRATTSLPLFLQMVGRGSRMHPGKAFFTVLDYGENYKRHGLWDMDFDWQKKWRKQKKRKEGVAPIKLCPKCEYINPASALTCRNCGYVFQPNEIREDTNELTQLVELTEKYRNLIGLRISQLTAPQLALYGKMKNKKPFAARVAKSHHQKDGKFLYDYAAAMGYKPYWVIMQEQQMDVRPIEFHDIILR